MYSLEKLFTGTLYMTLALLLEATTVGCLLAVLLVGWTTWVGPIFSPWQAMVAGLVVGACFHLACEFSGMNRWYCSHGVACHG